MTYLILVAILSNPWIGAHGDWAPLNREYAHCQETSKSTLSYLVCTQKAYTKATTNTVFV